MIERSIINIIFSSLYISFFYFYIFKLDVIYSFVISFFSIFIPYLIQLTISRKKYLACDLSIEPKNLIVSFFLNIFKVPIFCFIVNKNYYYYKYGRIFYKHEMTQAEISFMSLIFIIPLLLISFLSLFFLPQYSIIPSSILFSSLLPLNESFGIKIFFGYRKFLEISYYTLLLITSFLLFLVSIGLYNLNL